MNYKKNLKAALYIEEREAREEEFKGNINNIFEEWIDGIKLPRHYISDYLKEYSISKDEFCSIILQNNITENKKSSLEWVIDFEEIVKTFDQEYDILKFINKKHYKIHPFKFFPIPFLKWIYNKIKDKIKNLKSVNEDVAISSILENCFNIIINLSIKALIVELKKFGSENNRNSSTENYKEFCYQNSKKEMFINFACKYPVLLRCIIEQCMKSTDFLLEALINFNNDIEDIENMFNISAPFINIQMNMGDTHNGKKTVLIFEFEKGSVVYKPRNMEIDERFNIIIDYINQKKLKYELPKVKLLIKKDYGWQEYIKNLSCSCEEEVKEVYYKIGVFTALFYLLSSSDMHMENLIICKSNPYFVDLESLIQGYKGVKLTCETSYETIIDNVRNSVFNTCLFPAHINDTSEYDLSGITGHGGQVVLKGKYVVENPYTDNMKLVRKTYVTKNNKNIPCIHKKRVDPRKYVDSIIFGFKECYDLIQNNKQDFISSKGLFNFFNNIKVRTIVRDSKKYSTMLKAATDPKYLSNSVERNKLFDRMWGILNNSTELIDVIPVEINDLKNGDIPYFYSFINSYSIFDNKGNEYPNFYKYRIIDEIVSKVKNMNIADREIQIDFISRSLSEPIKRWDLKQYKKNYINTSELSLEDDDVLLNESKKIAKRIIDTSVKIDKFKDINWLNISISKESQWIFSPLDNSLYDGVLGLALYFSCMYKVTKNQEYMDVVNRLINESEIYIQKYTNFNSLSVFSGEASIAYCYYFIGILLNKQNLKDKAIYHLKMCEKYIDKDNNYDIIAGCSGTLIIALRIYEKCHVEEILKLAISCGEHLIKNAVNIDDGISWNTLAGGDMFLAGMSHGNAGIAWALIELYKATNNLIYYEYAKKAIIYERKLFIAEDKNWSDMRNRKNRLKKGFPDPVHWCHGAPGIGMARIKCFNIVSDECMKDEILKSIEKTLESGFGGSDCLCHGSFGNLELLLLASEELKWEKYHLMAKKITFDLITNASKEQWYCGIPQKFQTPTFMVGLSGIGYGLLRVLMPKKIPSVLTLELPEDDYEKA